LRYACSVRRHLEGDVFEAMNFAGVQAAGRVRRYNNQWAISVPLRLQTASETLAQKAIAAGFIGEQVDQRLVAMHAQPKRRSKRLEMAEAPAHRGVTTGSAIIRPRTTPRATVRPRVQARWKESRSRG